MSKGGKLNSTEKAIIKVFLERNEWLTTREISLITEQSWNTVKKYCDQFLENGWIKRQKRGNREYWKGEEEK